MKQNPKMTKVFHAYAESGQAWWGVVNISVLMNGGLPTKYVPPLFSISCNSIRGAAMPMKITLHEQDILFETNEKLF